MSRIADDQIHHSPTRVPSVADALQQMEAEYREMPGLSLTETQARRLWGLDHTTCRHALDTLVQRGVLRRNHREVYVRAESFSRLSAASVSGAATREPR
jgi:DNA-binding GntR family transcriptional regulator